jgi:hypothetical protein
LRNITLHLSHLADALIQSDLQIGAFTLETKAVESVDKNVVIDRVESLGQVDEYSCTVWYFIDGGYDVV